MTHHRKIAIRLGVVMGAATGVGFGFVLAQRDWDSSPFLGRHQSVVGGVVMGVAVALLFSCARVRTPDSSDPPAPRPDSMQ